MFLNSLLSFRNDSEKSQATKKRISIIYEDFCNGTKSCDLFNTSTVLWPKSPQIQLQFFLKQRTYCYPKRVFLPQWVWARQWGLVSGNGFVSRFVSGRGFVSRRGVFSWRGLWAWVFQWASLVRNYHCSSSPRKRYREDKGYLHIPVSTF